MRRRLITSMDMLICSHRKINRNSTTYSALLPASSSAWSYGMVLLLLKMAIMTTTMTTTITATIANAIIIHIQNGGPATSRKKNQDSYGISMKAMIEDLHFKVCIVVEVAAEAMVEVIIKKCNSCHFV